MSSATIALATNLAVAALLAAAFTALGFYNTRARGPFWLALTYLVGLLALSIEFVIAGGADSRFMVVLNFGAFLVVVVLFNVGIAARNGLRAPWLLMGGLLLASLASTWIIEDWPRESLARLMLYQAPYALMQFIGAWLALQRRQRERSDTLLAVLLVVSGLQFLSKPFFALAMGGAGKGPSDYLATTYATISLSLTAIVALALALTMLLVFARDILRDVTERSETDPLAGVLTRAGFDRRADAELRTAAGLGLPVSLVLADLDHFKKVNDTLGHASGDRVIEAFGRFVRAAPAHRVVAGRIGGEEFAILLPGSNMAAARLFAEGTRTTFSSLAIEGLPPQRRFTASFGVAEATPGESLAELFKRADEALYRAKADGRDCVRMALSRTSLVSLRQEGGGTASATGPSAPVESRYWASSAALNR
ncbi:MAG: GGDEF domain-containing protein [Mesorhizobium amorphae]|nr:MAG: GGDEF domain-containing protein [Mesorhizobium amorphae]